LFAVVIEYVYRRPFRHFAAVPIIVGAAQSSMAV
jgi:hypothetical protein